eukprot:1941268-Pleurochrysis_carterae.AAC.1
MMIYRMLESMHRIRKDKIARQQDAGGTMADECRMSQQEKRMDVEDILLRSFAEASHGGSLDERIKAGDEVLETFHLAR